jgi:superfamily II DNA/RNA helicase
MLKNACIAYIPIQVDTVGSVDIDKHVMLAYLQGVYRSNSLQEGNTIIFIENKAMASVFQHHTSEYFASHSSPSFRVFLYHAEIPEQEKKDIIAYMRQPSEERIILFATSACGQGIDLPNVRTVMFIHADVHHVLWHQSATRAGRDGQNPSLVLSIANKDTLSRKEYRIGVQQEELEKKGVHDEFSSAILSSHSIQYKYIKAGMEKSSCLVSIDSEHIYGESFSCSDIEGALPCSSCAGQGQTLLCPIAMPPRVPQSSSFPPPPQRTTDLANLSFSTISSNDSSNLSFSTSANSSVFHEHSGMQVRYAKMEKVSAT